ncbi:MAG: UvrD-helicase domain-containing protein, partial [Vicinamibacteria bacterium]|nr:UvrD-helicase domain-containing protein [Vicinamibacteria bacterium]
MKAPRADETARQEVRGKAQRSFAIEAGAGTGKTTLLIDRIEHLIRSGHAGLLEIAAVTFTENAAGEMKLRLRERLEGVIASHDTPKIERRRAEQALAELDRATVTTLHSLCSAILAERPFECGVVPGFRVADEVEADALFEQAWQEWLTER